MSDQFFVGLMIGFFLGIVPAVIMAVSLKRGA
jgi:hypothetical protein